MSQQLIQEIAQEQSNLNHVNFHLNGLRQQIAVREATLVLEVANEKDDKDKPKYANEATRNAALTLIRSGDEELGGLWSAELQLEKSRAEVLVQLEEARNKFKLELIARREQIAQLDAAA